MSSETRTAFALTAPSTTQDAPTNYNFLLIIGGALVLTSFMVVIWRATVPAKRAQQAGAPGAGGQA